MIKFKRKLVLFRYMIITYKYKDKEWNVITSLN